MMRPWHGFLRHMVPSTKQPYSKIWKKNDIKRLTLKLEVVLSCLKMSLSHQISLKYHQKIKTNWFVSSHQILLLKNFQPASKTLKLCQGSQAKRQRQLSSWTSQFLPPSRARPCNCRNKSPRKLFNPKIPKSFSFETKKQSENVLGESWVKVSLFHFTGDNLMDF